MAYRVDTVPLWLRPFFYLWSGLCFLAFLVSFYFFRLCCFVKYEGRQYIPEDSGVIYVTWHENLPLYFMTHLRMPGKQVWLNHPLWYMKPVHLVLRFFGVKELAYGSSGNSGKGALAKVITRLKEGSWSTTINPDGPAGPAFKMKSGALMMSKESGIPIVPITFSTSKEIRLSGWDRKRIPIPFSSVTVTFGKPIYVGKDEMETAQAKISAAMS